MFCLTRSVVLMGIKHCGKSTQGKLLSKYFNCPFFDTDDQILKICGMSARKIYLEKGEDEFKKAETLACKAICENIVYRPAVIATGGGICDNDPALETLGSSGGLFVFLDVTEKTASDRILKEAIFENGKIKNIPAYIAKKNPHTEEDVRIIFHDFYKRRNDRYVSLADLTLSPSSCSANENSKKLVSLLLVAGAAAPSATA
ncbi:shikimate kinase [Treponema parvum]|uniref:shikimate kinase n=1 Tax=Treponema parvum TaxID=138851 RepID=UPI001AEC4DEE|nr:shikimate kinase [Treponema parvum]QTQ15332.1 hypothetical protein HXT04_00650 [Treponema parvum]